MEKLFNYISVIMSAMLLLTACEKEEITPTEDFPGEYEPVLALNEHSSKADTIIYDWYKKYNTAFLYRFEDKDFRWLWAGNFTNAYTPFDTTNQSDSIALLDLLKVIDTYLIQKFDTDFLKENLPYKVFLTKELRSSSNSTSTLTSSWKVALTNGQEAMMVGYWQKGGKPFSKTSFDNELNATFGSLYYGNLPTKPDAFVKSRLNVFKFNLLTYITDPAIEAETKQTPPFENTNHRANVCGFIMPSKTIYLPSEAQDYADYLSFITKRPGSEIRKITSNYWRVAMRAQLFIEFFKTANGKDLIAQQNATFPDDKVTIDDFKYTTH